MYLRQQNVLIVTSHDIWRHEQCNTMSETVSTAKTTLITGAGMFYEVANYREE